MSFERQGADEDKHSTNCISRSNRKTIMGDAVLLAHLSAATLCPLQLVFIFFGAAEGYSLNVQSQYTYGSIMKLKFMYKVEHDNETSTLTMSANGQTVMTCSVPPHRGKRIQKSTKMQNEYYQIIEMPSDFIVNFNNVSQAVVLKFTIEQQRGSAQVTKYTDVRGASGVDQDIFDTAVEICDSTSCKGEATQLLDDPKLPQVSLNKEIIIKVTNRKKTYSYHLKLHRINTVVTGLCPMQHLPGKIDLGELYSLESLCPCENDMVRTSLTIGAYMMPHGYIRVSVLVEDQGQVLYECRRYFEVKADTGSSEFPWPLHKYSTPYADEFTSPIDVDLVINTSRSFFPALTRSYGVSRNFPIVPKYQLFCSGSSNFCGNLKEKDKPYVYIGRRYLVKHIRTMPVTINLDIQWSYREGTNEISDTVPHKVVLEDNALLASIICVRNCRNRYVPAVAGIFMARCDNCNYVDPTRLEYTWRTDQGVVAEGLKSKYLTITKARGPTFSITLTVTYYDSNNKNQTYRATAKKTLPVAGSDPTCQLIVSVARSLTSTIFDTFDISIETKQPCSSRNSAPVKRFFRLKKKRADNVNVCSFTTPIKNIALRLPNKGRRMKGFAGLQFADGTRREKKLWIPAPDPNRYVVTGSLVQRCNATRWSTEFGLSNVVALAQEIFRGKYRDDDIEECYKMVKSKVLGKDIHPARYDDAYRIQWMFFMAHDKKQSVDSVIEAFKNMGLTKHLIFEKTLQTTEDLESLTLWSFQALVAGFAINAKFRASKKHERYRLERDLRVRLENGAIELMRLHETRDKIFTYNLKIRAVYMWWTDILDTNSSFIIKFQTSYLRCEMIIPRQVFVDTLTPAHGGSSSIKLQDYFVNVMVTISHRIMNKEARKRLNHGTVDMYTELKTPRQEIKLMPKKQPIQLTFQRMKFALKERNFTMQVDETNSKVTDSTCLVFAVTHSDSMDLTLDLVLTGPSKYSFVFAAIDAKYPSEYLDFTEAKFQSIGKHFSYFMTKASSAYKITYPLSRWYFMIRASTATDSGVGLGPGKIHRGGRNSTKKRHGPKIKTTQTVNVRIKLFRRDCYYLVGDDWRSDHLCQLAPNQTVGIVKCNCYVDAPYSARQHQALRYLKEFKPHALDYNGPTLIPASFVLGCLTMFLYYCYWALFLDWREEDCAQTHVVKNMYNPNSPEQYLVCISTGAMPGSGTDNRVSFLLVGESGSLQTVMPEGRFCYSTSSEIWFLMSSDLELGYITGVTVNCDRIVGGAALNPWFLKRVVVYSKRLNHVISFEANRTMGTHLPTLVLPTVPHTSKWGEETFLRFWRIMKAYHLLVSVMFHVPGKGVNRCMSAVASMTVIAASCALAIEIIGAPTPVYHLNVLKVMGSTGYMVAILDLLLTTCFMSLFLKNLFSLVFRKSIGVIWYNNLEPAKGFHEGPTIQRNTAKTWLTNKTPLTYEPEVNPKWFIRQTYFPYRKSGQFRPSLRTIESGSDLRTSVDTGTIHRRSTAYQLSLRRTLEAAINEPFGWLTDQEAKPPTEVIVSSSVDGSDHLGSVDRPSTQFSHGLGIRRHSQFSGLSKISRSVADTSEASFASYRLVKDTRGSFSISDQASEQSHPDKRKKTQFATHQLGHGSDIADTPGREKMHGLPRFQLTPDFTTPTRSSNSSERSKLSKESGEISKTGSPGGGMFGKFKEWLSGSERQEKERYLKNSKPADANRNRQGSDSDGRGENYQSQPMGQSASEEHGDLNGHAELTEPAAMSPGLQHIPVVQRRSYQTENMEPVHVDINGVDNQEARRSTSAHNTSQSLPLRSLHEPQCMCSDTRHEPERLASNDALSSLDLSISDNSRSHPYEGGDEDSRANSRDPRVRIKKCLVEWSSSEEEKDSSTENQCRYALPIRKPSYGVSDSTVTDFDRRIPPRSVLYTRQGISPAKQAIETNIKTNLSLRSSSSSTVPPDSEISQGSNIKERHDMYSKPRHTPMRSSTAYITSFRHYYFRPILRKDAKSGRWQKASLSHSNVRFLRNSRYLEKLAKEYDLGEVMFPHLEVETHAGNERWVHGYKTTADNTQCEELVSEIMEQKESIARNSFVSESQDPLLSLSSDLSKETNSQASLCTSQDISSTALDPERLGSKVCLPETNQVKVSVWGGLVQSITSCVSCGSPCPCACAQGNDEMKRSVHPRPSKDRGSISLDTLMSKRDGIPQAHTAARCGGRVSLDMNYSAGPLTNIIETDLDDPHAATVSAELEGTNTDAPLVVNSDGLQGAQSNNSVGVEDQSHDMEKRRTFLCDRLWMSANNEVQNFMTRMFDAISDSLVSVWSLKFYLIKLPVVIVFTWVIIFCSGWVCFNGLYYSFQQGVDWLVVVVAVMLLEVVVLEPGIYLCCAIVSSHVWRKPLLINECLRRFRGVVSELYYREWMVELSLASRHMTSFIHTQAAPESASLFHLHDKIYKALREVIGLPDVVFHTGVYWLIVYTASTLLLVNLEADIYHGHMQQAYTKKILGLPNSERPISVEDMWDYLGNRLQPALMSMQDNVNLTTDSDLSVNTTGSDMGTMLLSTVRLKQIRTRPMPIGIRCSPLPRSVKIDPQRQCNFELNDDNMETRSFAHDWHSTYRVDYTTRYTHVYDEAHMFGKIDLLPASGYVTVVGFDENGARSPLDANRYTEWIDEHTRYLLVDFSLVNLNSHIVSSFRIRFDFRRAAVFWHVSSFHFPFQQPGNHFYYMAVVGLFFVIISGYNIVKEALLLYKAGILGYLSELSRYIEIVKVLLSLMLVIVYVRKSVIINSLLQRVKLSYVSSDDLSFVDFFEVAVMDYVFTVAGGFLTFICIFQIFDMLSKIRRLLVFIRLLISAVTLFLMPLMMGIAFAFLSHLLFGCTNENFSNIRTSYLMITQYFIKPRAIYESLMENNPYIGPWFVFALGFCINFFVVNFFIVFLNEAYSSILNQVRIGAYKIREKTRMEYMCDFLGIQSTITWDVGEANIGEQDKEIDKDYVTEIKRLFVN